MKNILVITGAASGFGKEFVRQMNQKEKDVDEIWAIDYDQEGLDKLKEEFEKVVCIHADLTVQDNLKKVKNKLDDEKPNIKALFNCAGYGVFDHTENVELDLELNMIDLNVKAYVSMIHYALPYMKEGSKLLNIASCAGFQPLPYINCYAATKAFVLSYSRTLNRELKYRGIHVLTVTPFWTKTNFFKRAIVPERPDVVLKYTAMYEPQDVARKAINDLYSGKDVSVYGLVNKGQHALTKLLPHSLILKIWMRQQKYDGTPNIR